MYKAGFNNRGTFYKIFSLKYGTTPKKYRESKTVELDDLG
jgi:methylphosphotriester-DNA--protein-cysteine methyltransferase